MAGHPHYLINTLWRCQLHCPYCLLPHIAIRRDVPEHGWSEWAVALRDHTPQGSVLDFAGGDPLLMDGLANMLSYLAFTGRGWAITTNALDDAGVKALCAERPPNCVQVNISDHPGSQGKATANIERLQACFRVVFNRVDTPLAGHAHDGQITSVIPYQSWREGTELDGIRRWCDSGAYHWVADPGGNVYRCNPHMATAREPIGNLFDGKGIVTPEPIICETGCSTCYTIEPDAWPVTMYPVDAEGNRCATT